MPISFVKYVVDALFSFLEFAILAAVILSWLVQFGVVNYHNAFVRQIGGFLDAITRPLFAPVRKVIPSFGGVDLSPVIVLILIVGVHRYLVDPLLDNLMAATGIS